MVHDSNGSGLTGGSRGGGNCREKETLERGEGEGRKGRRGGRGGIEMEVHREEERWR